MASELIDLLEKLDEIFEASRKRREANKRLTALQRMLLVELYYLQAQLKDIN